MRQPELAVWLCYLIVMSKTDDIAKINAGLAGLAEADVAYVADIVGSMTTSAEPLRALSQRERDRLAASRRDFAEGRTLTMEESARRTDALLARLKAQEHKSA